MRKETYLSNDEANEFRRCAKTMVVTCYDGEHQCADQETLDLNPSATEDLNGANCDEVPWHIARCGDDEITVGVFEKCVVFRFTLGEANGGEKDRLIEIETVERHID